MRTFGQKEKKRLTYKEEKGLRNIQSETTKIKRVVNSMLENRNITPEDIESITRKISTINIILQYEL